MLYNIFRVFLWLMYICFFRRVYYLNFNRIPKKEPLIFISNHSNGFMDPILIAAMQPRPVYFWARAGEFPNNFKGWLLLKLHGMPIYRQQEGKDQMHKNEITFKKTRDLLHKGWNSVFIAPEGRCKIQKRLHPFKTGCARLAFQVLEENNWQVDVKIQPSGVNYTQHDLFRSDVYINLGHPISVLSYKALYMQDKTKAIQQLTADMFAALRAQMVYIEEEDADMTEMALKLIRSNNKRGLLPWYSTNEAACVAEQRIAEKVGTLDATRKEGLSSALNAYERLLDEANLSDFAVAQHNKRYAALLMLLFPVWLLGTLAGTIPHRLARALRNKFVPFREFAVSFAFTAAFVVWMLWSILWIIPLFFVMNYWAFLVPVFMAILQMMAYHYTDYWKEWCQIRRFKAFADKGAVEQQRKAILSQLI